MTVPYTPGEGWRVSHLGFAAPGRTEMFGYDEGPLWDGAVRVQTLFAGISTGTELTHFQGTNPYLHARFDPGLGLFVENQGHDHYPLPFSGYMQVGKIVESKSPAYREGEVVGMTYGHKSGHTADPRHELLFPLPADLDPMLGIYVAQMGPICVNGILHADEEAFGGAAQDFGCGVAGRNVLVTGTGVIGLMTGMLCKWAGAAEVAVAGRNAFKLGVAERIGLTPIDTTQTDVGTWCKERWHDGVGTRGAHFAFQCSGSDELLDHALRGLQPQGTVVDLGFYQGGTGAVPLGREFHHNGLKHISAQIFNIPRKLRAGWDRRRMANTTLAFLRDKGPLVREQIITHVLPFDEAQKGFEMLATNAPNTLQVVLQC